LGVSAAANEDYFRERSTMARSPGNLTATQQLDLQKTATTAIHERNELLKRVEEQDRLIASLKQEVARLAWMVSGEGQDGAPPMDEDEPKDVQSELEKR
jgi:hypothetical protein